MEHRNRIAPLRCALGLLVTLVVAGCGGGSNQAAQLLRETFSGAHRVDSGQVAVLLTVAPSGPSALKGPLGLSLVGPFQSLGPGRLPASSFTLSLKAMGRTGAVTITSTGPGGYVTFQGRSFRLPQQTFERLESTFAQLGSPPGESGSGTLSRLGIHPERWLVNPQVIGNEAIDGIATTHLRSGIDMSALLADLNTFLQHTAAVGATAAPLPRGISAASRRQIAEEVKNAVVNVWTGVADKTLRRLELELKVPVSGPLSVLLGRSAAIALTMAYTNLNQPQLITSPAKLARYSEFQSRLKGLVADFEGGLVGTSAGGG